MGGDHRAVEEQTPRHMTQSKHSALSPLTGERLESVYENLGEQCLAVERGVWLWIPPLTAENYRILVSIGPSHPVVLRAECTGA